MPETPPALTASEVERSCDFCGKPRDHYHADDKTWPMADGEVLWGAVIDRSWMTSGAMPPREWEEGLWGLDAAVRAAIRGGWTNAEIVKEIGQLVESHRGLAEVGEGD